MSRYIVMCRVSGGITGTRQAPLKETVDGVTRVRYFDTLEAAQAHAAQLELRPRNPYSTANFRYWAAVE